MIISATIIADSISPQGIQLTTMQVTCHRFILPEVNTHRVFSRNWRSSRAVPVKKLIQEVRDNPALPIHWGRNQAGMQAREELSEKERRAVRDLWLQAREEAVNIAEHMVTWGAHKQLVNRVLEPFLWVHGVITATDWANFYALRRHADAQPEIKALADAIWEAQQASEPELLEPGQWHLPYIHDEDWESLMDHVTPCKGFGPRELNDCVELAKKVSVARCARVSYLTHEGHPTTIEEDLALYARLMERAPLHASPAEHQATPDEYQQRDDYWFHKEQWGNFRGWRQFRKTLPGEYVPG